MKEKNIMIFPTYLANQKIQGMGYCKQTIFKDGLSAYLSKIIEGCLSFAKCTWPYIALHNI